MSQPRRPVGLVPEGPAEGDQLQTRMEEGGGSQGAQKTGIIFRGSLKGSKIGTKSLREGENVELRPHVPGVRAGGQTSHHPCRSPSSPPQGAGQG